jgi:hypothetical protein
VAGDVETLNGDPAAKRAGLRGLNPPTPVDRANYPAGPDANEFRAVRRIDAWTVTMEFVSTAIVVAIVATLMLLGLGMVINQLLRLKKFLKDSPPDAAPGGEVREPPDQPH